MSGAPPRTTIAVASLVEHIAHFQLRSIQAAVSDALADQWRARAEAFEAAKPKPGDYFGTLTRDEVRAQWHRLDQIARACRARAQVALLEDLAPEVQAILREAA